jgi:hypothetical protein
MARSDRLFAGSMIEVLQHAERHRMDSSFVPNYAHPLRSAKEEQTLSELFHFLISDSAPEAPPAKNRNPEGEVLRTHRVKQYAVGTTGRLYSARVREEYPGAWSALVTCTHLDSFGRATVSMGGSPTVVCRTVGTFPGKARATKEALEALNLHTADMRYTVEEPEDSAIVLPISE